MNNKLVVTLDIDYDPRITNITFPYMRLYAANIGADFKVIKKRKYDDKYPVTLEKFQLYEISEPYESTVYLDADYLINPQCIDLTETIDNDMVLVPGCIDQDYIFKPHNILGKYNIHWHYPLFMSVFSQQTRCVFKLPEIDPLELTQYINTESVGYYTYQFQKKNNFNPQWFLDEFIYSLNIEKYKVVVGSIKESFPDLNIGAHPSPKDEKIDFLNNRLKLLNSRLKTMTL